MLDRRRRTRPVNRNAHENHEDKSILKIQIEINESLFQFLKFIDFRQVVHQNTCSRQSDTKHDLFYVIK